MRLNGGPGTSVTPAAPINGPRLRRALALTIPEKGDEVAEDAPAITLVRHVLARLALELLHYEVLIRLRTDPEDVHRARSTVRRLRAVLHGIRAFLDRVWADTLREELRWFAGELASVRDIDVTLSELRTRAQAIPSDERPYLEAVLEPLGAAREAARVKLLETLDGSRYIALMHALEAAATTPKLANGELPCAGELGRRSLRKNFKRVRRAVEGAPESCSPTELHHARIVVRNGRYVAEACAPVLGKPARRLAKRLASMQESLGAISDATLIQNRLRALSVHDRANILIGQLLALQAAEGDRARHDWRSLRRKALREGWLHA